MNRVRFIALVFSLLALGLGGCANVQPWEHATMAGYRMSPDRDPLKGAIDEHIYFSREASTGSRGVGGAGCGCN